MAVTDRQVLWTALPAGIVNGTAQLSVYVSPRLTPPGTGAIAGPVISTLGAHNSATDATVRYPEFLHWAALTQLTFQVQLDNGKSYPATFTEQRKPDLWNALFPAETPVTVYTFQDFSKWNIITPPVNALAQYLANTYKSVAKLGPQNVPTSGDLFNLFQSDLVEVGDKGERVGPLSQILSWMSFRATQPFTLATPALQHIAQLYSFLKPTFPATTLPAASSETGLTRPIPPTPEFHQILSSLASYPQVLRWLGIVFDLSLDAAGTAAVKAGAKVRVLPMRANSTGVDKSPWTSYATSVTNGFAATVLPGAPNATDFTSDGLLAVDQPRYGVVPLDVSGAAVNLCNFVEQVTTRNGDPKMQAGLPALRSAGLSLVVDGRSADIAHIFQSANQNNTAVTPSGDGSNITMGAAELTRGIRVDVWDSDSKAWASLCGRTYQISGTSTNSVTDDGTLTTSATQHSSFVVGSAGELRMVESLFRWMGSGLCTPPPGAPAAEKTGAHQVKLSTPAALTPQLLFGRGYRFRARRVDLAGNGVASDDPSLTTSPHITPLSLYWTKPTPTHSGPQLSSWRQVAAPTRYLRYEPVVAPTLRPVTVATELHGESNSVLVVRTAVSPAASTLTNTRRIDPPAVSSAVALQHGVPPSQIKNPHQPDPVVVRDPKHPSQVAPNQDKITIFNSAVAQTQILNYTPDPLAAGASFQVSTDGTFSNLQSFVVPPVENANSSPFLLRLMSLAAGATPTALITAPLATSSNLPVLIVSLPPASVLKLRISSTLTSDGVELLALWDIIKQATVEPHVNDPLAANETLNARLMQATQGLFPMLTPFHEITLVHAVEKPLAPALLNLTCQPRTQNQTSAYITGGLQSDRNSTNKVDLEATWSEWMDTFPEPPKHVQHNTHVLSATIAISGSQPDTIGGDALPCHQEFGDTRYRQVSYQPTASTRFAEYFPTVITRLGQTYLPPINQQQNGPSVALSIPSTARPPAPAVRYIMPTFRWTRSDSNGTVISQRLGGGFRVFLDRPWYRSGDGELLAVVVANPNSEYFSASVRVQGTTPSNTPPSQPNAYPVVALQHYVTSIGADPISVSGGPSTYISRDNFLNATKYASALVLPEAASNNIDVAGYSVNWSSAHQSWYADIHVDPYQNQGNKLHYFGYMPFVRFALARYQPNSISGCEVSPVVRMDSVQSVPDRKVQIEPVLALPGINTKPSFVSFILHLIGETQRSPNEVFSIDYEAYLEGTRSEATTAQSETDWVVIPNAINIRRDPDDLYSATIALPSARGTRGYRVIVKEIETYPSDKGEAKRIIYVDAVLL